MISAASRYFARTGRANYMPDYRADYDAARSSRMKRGRPGVSATGRSADYHIRNEGDYLRMMEMARDMARNDIVIKHALNQLTDTVIQDGSRVDPDTGDEELNKRQYDKWTEWCNDADECDIAGEMTFSDFERVNFKGKNRDGDHWNLGLQSGHLQGIEGHRARTPRTKLNVVHGVLLDEMRRRMQVWITKDEIAPNQAVNKVGDMIKYDIRDEFGVRQVFQVYDAERVSQTRGVTALAPATNHITMIDDINVAKLVQQQIASCFAILRMREMDFDGTGNSLATGETDTQSYMSGGTQYLKEIQPGMEWTGEPGEKLEGFSPNIPNNEYFQQVMLILQFIAINLDLPVQVLLLDPTKTNFSGWRGAIDQAKHSWRRMQRQMIRQFNRPVYLWKLNQWISEDPYLREKANELGRNFFKHRWHTPNWPYIQPEVEAKADAEILRNMLKSPRRLHNERGQDWQDIVRETIEDRKTMVVMAKETAKQINDDHDDGDPVKWRELVSLPEAHDAPQANPGNPGNPGTNPDPGNPGTNPDPGSRDNAANGDDDDE